MTYFYGYLIYFVKYVDTGYVDPVAFNNIDQVVLWGVLPQGDVSVVYFVLCKYGLHRVRVQRGLCDRLVQIDTTFVFLLERNIWRFLV